MQDTATRMKSMENTPLSEIRALFIFLAENFLAPPSEKIPPQILELAPLKDILHTSNQDATEEEYHAVFSGTRSPSPALWESCYAGKEETRRLLNGVTRDVAAAYREAGLHVDEGLKQPPDHIGVECAFFAFLCSSAAFSAERVSFLDKHLRPFASAFADALEKSTTSRFYAALASVLREAVKIATEATLTGAPGDFPEKHAEYGKHLPIGLRAIKEGETPEGSLEIPICGINDCGSRCPLTAEVSGGCVLKVRASRHPDARRKPSIDICSKGAYYDRTFLSGSRLRYPMMRVGDRGEGKFKRITWDEATDTIAREVRRIGRQYGPQSRYVNYSDGVSAAARGDSLAKNLLALDGGYLGRYASYSTACTSAATPYTYGTIETGNSSKYLLNSKLIILWGHNPIETHFGASMKFYLREAKKKGIPIVVIDPRFSDTAAELADRWIGIRPTTDSALIDAAAYVILDEGLQDQEFMDRFCLGFDAGHMPPGMEDCENYRDYVFGKYDGTPKTPDWAAPITGVDADTIRWLARTYAGAKPAALLQGWGPQRHGNGEQATRSGTLLPCLTGNIGIAGGDAGGSGYVKRHKKPAVKDISNPCGAMIPSFLWTDAVLRGKDMTAQEGLQGVEKLDSGIKMIFNMAGNMLISQHSDVSRTAEILKDTSLCEFIVCSDVFLTPSAKFADILLPGTSMFEGENIGSPWREGDYVLFCNKSIEPLFECRFEFDWLSDVARKLGLYDQFTGGGKDLRGLLEESYNAYVAAIGEPGAPDFETFRRDGIYRSPGELSFIAFEENVRGPQLPFSTPSGKIEIFSQRLHAMSNPLEIPAIPKYVPSFEGPGDPQIKRYPFQLIGWHSKRRANSTHDNNPVMDKLEPHRVWINTQDAEAGGIREDDWVEVFNDRGRVRIQARVTDRIIRGVLAIPQGGWYTPDARGVDTRGINTLSTARPTPLANGNPQHSNLVDIAPYRP